MITDKIQDFLNIVPAKACRLLALDYGSAKIGVASCDELWMLASAFDTLQRENMRKDIGIIARIAREEEIAAFVIGWPLEMDGSVSENCEKIRSFASKLEKKTGLPIFLQDERLSTAAVTSVMKQHDVKRKDRQKSDDMLAAAEILQRFLEQVG